jgi:hypothetical protein
MQANRLPRCAVAVALRERLERLRGAVPRERRREGLAKLSAFGMPEHSLTADQLASRARQSVRTQDADLATNELRHAKLVEAFLAAARSGEFDQLVAVLGPDVVLLADPAAAELGAPPEARGAIAVAGFCERARGAVPALLNGAAAVASMPGGQLRVVFKFTATSDKITAIDLIADPARLRHLDLIAPLEQHGYPQAPAS